MTTKRFDTLCFIFIFYFHFNKCVVNLYACSWTSHSLEFSLMLMMALEILETGCDDALEAKPIIAIKGRRKITNTLHGVKREKAFAGGAAITFGDSSYGSALVHFGHLLFYPMFNCEFNDLAVCSLIDADRRLIIVILLHPIHTDNLFVYGWKFPPKNNSRLT